MWVSRMRKVEALRKLGGTKCSNFFSPMSAGRKEERGHSLLSNCIQHSRMGDARLMTRWRP